MKKALVSQRLGNWGFPLRTGRGKGKFCAPQGFRGHLCTQEKIMMGRYGGSLLTRTCGIRVHVCKWGWGAEVGSVSPFLQSCLHGDGTPSADTQPELRDHQALLVQRKRSSSPQVLKGWKALPTGSSRADGGSSSPQRTRINMTTTDPGDILLSLNSSSTKQGIYPGISH